MNKRIFDVLLAIIGFVFLIPFFIFISLLVKISSKGPIFYSQKRIGLNGREFNLLKFRTMFTGADKMGLLTVGSLDSRITPIGFYLRKFKIDEFPQLLNILKGEMSFIGPRPEVPKYVDLYTEQQKKILQVRPGLTDFASIYFRNENELLACHSNPEGYYIDKIMNQKIRLNNIYIQHQSICLDFYIIFKTIISLFN